MCDNPKMYFKGSQQPFCNFHFAKLYNTSPYAEVQKSFTNPKQSTNTSFPTFEEMSSFALVNSTPNSLNSRMIFT